jgi:tetratricopeptide (TPR) repeat protein
MTATEVLFENEEVQVLRRRGGSGFTLVTFGDLTLRPDGQGFWGLKVAEALDLDAVGFVAKRENWYPPAAIEPALPAVLPVLRRRRLGYGYSMGGYAALKHAARLGLTATLAVCPQTTIDPDDPLDDRRYAAFHQPALHAGMRVRPADLAPVTVVLADPYHPADAAHARVVVAAAGAGRRVTWLRAPHADHAAIWLLTKTRLLHRVIRLMLQGRDAELPEVLRRLRRGSPHWHRLMGRAALRYGHPALAERLWERAGKLGMHADILANERLEAREMRALRLRDLGRPEEAMAELRAVAQAQRANPLSASRLGHVMIALADWTGAEAQFRATLNQAPHLADAWLGLSLALTAQRRFEEAVEVAGRGHARLPEDGPLAAHLGNLLIRRDLMAEPALAAAAAWLGLKRLEDGAVTEAEDAFRRALVIAPAHEDAHLGLVAALRARGKEAEATAALREAARLCSGGKVLAAAISGLGPLAGLSGWADGAARRLGLRRGSG